MRRKPPRDWLAEVSGWHERTVRRRAARGNYPPWVARLMALELERELGALHGAWAGWSLTRDGKLAAPSGAEYSPGEVLALQLRWQQVRVLERELVRLRQELRARGDRPRAAELEREQPRAAVAD